VITLSSSSADIALFQNFAQTLPTSQIDLSSCNSVIAAVDNTLPVATYYLRVVDVNGNPMPTGTTIAITKTNGTILSTTNIVTPDSSACNSTFSGCPASAGSLALGIYPLSMQSDATFIAGNALAVPPVPDTCTNPKNTGVVTVTVTSPKGLITIATFNVND
jgi:hypothetical protein